MLLTKRSAAELCLAAGAAAAAAAAATCDVTLSQQWLYEFRHNRTVLSDIVREARGIA